MWSLWTNFTNLNAWIELKLPRLWLLLSIIMTSTMKLKKRKKRELSQALRLREREKMWRNILQIRTISVYNNDFSYRFDWSIPWSNIARFTLIVTLIVNPFVTIICGNFSHESADIYRSKDGLCCPSCFTWILQCYFRKTEEKIMNLLMARKCKCNVNAYPSP